MTRLFSDLKIKSFDEEQGVFIGIASTPSPDRTKDIVEPKGAVFSLPMPLLAYHNHEKVIGTVEAVEITESGIEVVCRVLKDITQEAKEIWGLIQNGAMRGLSIGFKSTESERLNNGGIHFKKYEWLELSVVPVAMNGQASITATKAATTTTQEGIKRMSISEQIASFKAKKAAVLASMDALITKGNTLNDDEDAQYKSAEGEVISIDAHIARLQAAEDRQAKSAQPISVSGVNIQVTDNTPKGTDFVRYTKAVALSRGNAMQALEIAKGMKYGDRVETVLKAAVSAGSTTSADFASLLPQQSMTSEFIDLLRPETILGKLSKVRNVPSNIRIPKATTGTSASWIGEGKPAPLTNGAFGDLEIGEHKIGAITVFTEELLRRSEPAADALVRDDLIAALTNAVDVAFIDSTNAGSAGVKPASIANGATSAAASGTTADKARADVKAAKKNAIAANQSLATGVWIMHPVTALSLESMVNATTGLREFPLINSVSGGSFEGLPVVLSTNVPGDDVAGYDVLLFVQGEILVAEGGLVIDASREASLQFVSDPTNDGVTPTPTELVSLFQTGCVATKVIRGITWTRRRPTAAYSITAAKYA